MRPALLVLTGCMGRTPDYGLAPVTPALSLQWPLSGDTVFPGPTQIRYDMDNARNAVRFELYVNDSLVVTVPGTHDGKKPVANTVTQSPAWTGADVEVLLDRTREQLPQLRTCQRRGLYFFPAASPD